MCTETDVPEELENDIRVIRRDCCGAEGFKAVFYDIRTDYGNLNDLTLEDICVIQNKLQEFIMEDL